MSLSSKTLFLLALFPLAFLVHFRPDAFFYWDAWHLMERFMANGPSAALIPHNEHFLPVSFYSIYLQHKLFGANYFLYLGLNILVHTLSSVLLYRILKRLLSFSVHQELAARVLALVYLLSSLHAEALQWAFEHTLVVATFLTFLSIERGLNYLDHGKGLSLVISALAAGLSPLCFGNGFVTGPLIGLLAIWSLSQNISVTKLSRILLLLSVVGLALSGSTYLYLKNTNVSESSETNYRYLAKYLAVGTQQGTVLRGLGLYPGMAHGSLRPFLGKPSSWSPTHPIRDMKDPENWALLAGTLLSAGFFLVALANKENRRRNLVLFFMGQAWIVLAFLLPALSRHGLGHGQAMSLRYQYLALPGLLLVIAPAILCGIATKNRAGRILFFAVIALHAGLQLNLARGFDYFTAKGQVNREFISKLQAGTAEKVPEVLTPGFNIETTKRVWGWLNAP